jgi:hypothetical protein
LALNSWVSFVVGVVYIVVVIVIVVVTVVAMKTGGLEKLPMNSHLLHLWKRTHD